MKELFKDILFIVSFYLGVFLLLLSTSYCFYYIPYNTRAEMASKIATYSTTSFRQSYADEQTKLAYQYNQDLIHGVKDDNYTEILNTDGSGMIGYISIPTLDVQLPVYHEASADSKPAGAVHVANSSLPAGEKGTHSVISDVSEKEWPGIVKDDSNNFIRLKNLKKGDKFCVTVLDKTYEYKVDKIESSNGTYINPDMTINPEENYVTLFSNDSKVFARGKLVDSYDRIGAKFTNTTPVTPFELVAANLVMALFVFVLTVMYGSCINRSY